LNKILQETISFKRNKTKRKKQKNYLNEKNAKKNGKPEGGSDKNIAKTIANLPEVTEGQCEYKSWLSPFISR
jgi:hypothetical protein